jgi:hypothetical protein
VMTAQQTRKFLGGAKRILSAFALTWLQVRHRTPMRHSLVVQLTLTIATGEPVHMRTGDNVRIVEGQHRDAEGIVERVGDCRCFVKLENGTTSRIPVRSCRPTSLTEAHIGKLGDIVLN